MRDAKSILDPIDYANILQRLSEWREDGITPAEISEILADLNIQHSAYHIASFLVREGFLTPPLRRRFHPDDHALLAEGKGIQKHGSLNQLPFNEYGVSKQIKGANPKIRAIDYIQKMKSLLEPTFALPEFRLEARTYKARAPRYRPQKAETPSEVNTEGVSSP